MRIYSLSGYIYVNSAAKNKSAIGVKLKDGQILVHEQSKLIFQIAHGYDRRSTIDPDLCISALSGSILELVSYYPQDSELTFKLKELSLPTVFQLQTYLKSKSV